MVRQGENDHDGSLQPSRPATDWTSSRSTNVERKGAHETPGPPAADTPDAPRPPANCPVRDGVIPTTATICGPPFAKPSMSFYSGSNYGRKRVRGSSQAASAISFGFGRFAGLSCRNRQMPAATVTPGNDGNAGRIVPRDLIRVFQTAANCSNFPPIKHRRVLICENQYGLASGLLAVNK